MIKVLSATGNETKEKSFSNELKEKGLEAISIIDSYKSRIDYEYEKPAKELFYSWVHSDGLRK